MRPGRRLAWRSAAPARHAGRERRVLRPDAQLPGRRPDAVQDVHAGASPRCSPWAASACPTSSPWSSRQESTGACPAISLLCSTVSRPAKGEACIPWLSPASDTSSHVRANTSNPAGKALESRLQRARTDSNIRSVSEVRSDNGEAAVRAENLPGLTAFADSLTSDLDAVTRGLTTRWNSGPIEGRVNHIKMLKRQIFGRASLPLLRKRVLLTASR